MSPSAIVAYTAAGQQSLAVRLWPTWFKRMQLMMTGQKPADK